MPTERKSGSASTPEARRDAAEDETIAALRRRIASLEESNERLSADDQKLDAANKGIMEAYPDPILIANIDGRIVRWNRKAENMFDAGLGLIAQSDLFHLILDQIRQPHIRPTDDSAVADLPKKHGHRMFDELRQRLGQSPTGECEVMERVDLETPAMGTVDARLTMSFFRDHDGLHRIMVTVTDVSVVNHDRLTGLLQRKVLENKLEREVAVRNCSFKDRRPAEPLVVMMFDIDHFKQINDHPGWGHPVGDQVIRRVAKTILKGVRKQDLVTRHGGEEFACVLVNSMDDAIAIAERIRRSLEDNPVKAHQADGSEEMIPVTVSVGIAPFLPGDTPASIVERADQALYAAKENGRNRVTAAVEKPSAS